MFFSILFLSYKLFPTSDRKLNLAKWIKDNGDEKYLISYPIKPNGLVLDIGGFTGQFSDKIIEKYNPYLYIFEPVSSFYQILKSKYNKNPKVTVFNFGLIDKNKKGTIFVSNDSSSSIKNLGIKEEVRFEDVSSVFKKIKGQVDLVSINIEGGEYVLLKKLIEDKLLEKISYLQVQFHTFVPNSKNLRQKLLLRILKTHKVRFSYPFTWESFELKKKYLNF